jgi:hypothetical protein
MEDTIKIDLKETKCKDVVWIYMALDKGQWQFLVNTVMKFGLRKW